ncbi:MAG: flippase-like domain-containing protein [Gammaproteobacteria bacterium]|nr:MAG: flippase-like domain-containing protein [Gammaproteobacteria bacterium]
MTRDASDNAVVEPAVSGKGRKYLLVLAKAAVTLAIVYWLVSSVNFGMVGRILTQARHVYLLLSCLLLTAVFLIGCLRWRMLIGHLGLIIPMRQALPSYYLGMFFNNFLPTGVGGDLARTIHLKLHGHGIKPLISSALADRTIGLAVMLLLGGISLLLSPELRLDPDRKLYLAGLIGLGLAGGVVLFWFSNRLPLDSLSRRYRHTRLRRGLIEIVHLLTTYRTALRQVFAAVLLSIVMQSLVIAAYYLLARGIGIELSLITFFAFVSMVQVAASLPISLGGLGVREGVLVALLAGVGVDIQLGVALSLLFLLTIWLCSLPGAIVMLLGRTRRGAQPAKQAS